MTNTDLVMYDSDSEEDNSVFAHPLIEDIYEKCVTIEPSEPYLTKMAQLDAIKDEPNSEYVVPAEISSQPIGSETSNDDHSDTEEELISRPIIGFKPNFSFRKSTIESTIVSPAPQFEGQMQRSNFNQQNSVNTYAPQFVRPFNSAQVPYYGWHSQNQNSVPPSGFGHGFVRPFNMAQRMPYSSTYYQNPVFPNQHVRRTPECMPPLSRPYYNQSNFTPAPQFVNQFNPGHGMPYHNNIIPYPPNRNLVGPFQVGAVGMHYNYPQNQIINYNPAGEHYTHYPQNHIYNTVENVARQILNVCNGPFTDVPNFKAEVTTAFPILGELAESIINETVNDSSISFANPVNNIDWIFAENYNINEIFKENPKSKRLYERQFDSTDTFSMLSSNKICDNKDTNLDVNKKNEESELNSLKEDIDFTINVSEKYETISNTSNHGIVENIELFIPNVNNRRNQLRRCCGFSTSLNHFLIYGFIVFLFTFLGIFVTVTLWIISE